MEYHWNLAVKFGGITSGIQVFSSGITNGIPLVYHWKSAVKFGGITTVLPLESTVLPVVIPPNFTADFHWYNTGNTTGIPLVIPETLSMETCVTSSDDILSLL